MTQGTHMTLRRRVLLAASCFVTALHFGGISANAAPQYSVRTACGTQAYTTGTDASPIMDVSGNACVSGGAAQGSTTAGQSGVLVQGAVLTGTPTYVTGQTSPLSLDTSGALRVGPYFAATGTAMGGTGANADGATHFVTGLNVAAIGFNSNGGTTLDRTRGNTTGTAVMEGGLPATHWSFASAAGGITNTTTAVTMKAAAGGVLRNCISNIQVTHALLGAATELAVRDGAAGTVLWRASLATPAVEGGSYNLTPAICGTANTLMEVVTLTATVTGGVVVSAQGYVSP